MSQAGKTELKTLAASTVLLIVMSISGVFLYKFVSFQTMTKADRLTYLLKRDMNLLKGTKHLHTGLKSLSEFELYAGTDKAKAWLPKLKLPWEKRKKGQYRLEVLLLDFSEKDQDFAVVQLNLVELDSENMVWELGRTYQLESYFYALF